MHYANFLRENNYISQSSVPMLMMTNLNAEELKALVAKGHAELANVEAAAALKPTKAKTVELLRATYPQSESRHAIEVEINECKDEACIDHIILNQRIKTCNDFKPHYWKHAG